MKVSKEKAAENRELILKEAARLFRERGVLGVGVDALTEAAGLTHGSLYSKFGSKDKLLAEALNDGYQRAAERANAVTSLPTALAGYLSPAHRDNPGSGCFMAALGSEGSRQSKEVRRIFSHIVKGNIARLANLLPARRKRSREDEALVTYATMVGAMVLARAIDDREFSDRILSVTRDHLVHGV